MENDSTYSTVLISANNEAVISTYFRSYVGLVPGSSAKSTTVPVRGQPAWAFRPFQGDAIRYPPWLGLAEDVHEYAFRSKSFSWQPFAY